MYIAPWHNTGEAQASLPLEGGEGRQKPAVLLPPPIPMLMWYAARGIAFANRKEPIPGTKNPRLGDWLPPVIQIIRKPGWLWSLQTYAWAAADLDAAPHELKTCLSRAFDLHGVEARIITHISETAERGLAS